MTPKMKSFLYADLTSIPTVHHSINHSNILCKVQQCYTQFSDFMNCPTDSDMRTELLSHNRYHFIKSHNIPAIDFTAANMNMYGTSVLSRT